MKIIKFVQWEETKSVREQQGVQKVTKKCLSKLDNNYVTYIKKAK